MTDTTNDTPTADLSHNGAVPVFPGEWSSGISLRQYAAIMLQVPDSGLPWLDTMIAKARRLDQARSEYALPDTPPAPVAKETT